MSRIRQFGLLGCCMIAVTLAGCGSKSPPGQKATFKVTGKLTVNGEIPKPSVTIVCHSADGETLNSDGMIPSANTDEQGSFEIKSYKAGDGLPEGTYVLTFSQQEFDFSKRRGKGADPLKDRYGDKKESKITFTVEKKPVDLATIELSTK